VGSQKHQRRIGVQQLLPRIAANDSTVGIILRHGISGAADASN